MFLVITMVVIASLIIFWQPDAKILFWQESISDSIASKNEAKNSTVILPSRINQVQTEEKSTPQYESKRDEIVEDFIPNPEAVASMRQARLEGDPRAPKLGNHHEREKPTEEELGDHEQYLEYERRQQKRVFRAYVEASKVKTAQLRSMIEKGKTEGVSPEEIAFAEDKIRGIEEMAIKLQQDHPDIMETSYQPPADWLIESLGKDDNPIKSTETQAQIAQ
ncbi:MAG: hypothetical protein ACJAW8_001136 [Oleispira sp.]|jgi:hypothetical protein|tara:strand:- start:1378 stop:2040 length:663 start_codon:yes stop_codon:yes gene_type:complete